MKENSEWQSCPSFLALPVCEWPMKSVKELAATARENISKLQKKMFAVVLTRAKTGQLGAKQEEDKTGTRRKRPTAGSVIHNLNDERRFSDLSRLVKTVAWIWRAVKRFI